MATPHGSRSTDHRGTGGFGLVGYASQESTTKKSYLEEDLGSPASKEQNGLNGSAKDDGSDENGNSRPSSRQSSQISYGNSHQEDYQKLIQHSNKFKTEVPDGHRLLPAHQVLSRAQLQLLLKQHSIFIQDQQNHHKQLYFHQQRNGLERRQLEQVMQQIQERLKANFIQQSHLLETSASSSEKKSPELVQSQLLALRQEQQQLMQQWQFTQRKYLLHRGFLNPLDEFRWDGYSGFSALPEELLEEFVEKLNPLYGHGMCKWPGCDSDCDDFQAFSKHLSADHNLDDRATAQARVQMQVVSQLEVQLQKERDRLHAMMTHLHMAKQAVEMAKNEQPETATNISVSTNACNVDDNKPIDHMTFSKMIAEVRSSVLQPLSSNISPAVRRKINEKASSALVGGLPYMLERAGLDVQQEIQRNQEFYKNADVRPPFTYASLIRQAIIESPEKQLTLNEIYNWFQNTFCYFRRNAATWKNAIRTNLSLHKCFVRYEDDFGSFWMVDDAEFVKRRHLSRGRPRKYDPAPSSSSSPNTNAHGIQAKCSTPANGHNGNVRHSPLHYPDKYNVTQNHATFQENEMRCTDDCSILNEPTTNMRMSDYRHTPMHTNDEENSIPNNGNNNLRNGLPTRHLKHHHQQQQPQQQQQQQQQVQHHHHHHHHNHHEEQQDQHQQQQQLQPMQHDDNSNTAELLHQHAMDDEDDNQMQSAGNMHMHMHMQQAFDDGSDCEDRMSDSSPFDETDKTQSQREVKV